MGITMFVQQRLNPQPPDPIQAKIFTFMPIMFTFLLAQFPAGLVIYWTWNNLLSIIQQAVIMSRAGVPIGRNPSTPAPQASSSQASSGQASSDQTGSNQTGSDQASGGDEQEKQESDAGGDRQKARKKAKTGGGRKRGKA